MIEVNQKQLQKVCLIVIDGWGLSNPDPRVSSVTGDAIKLASTPVMDGLAAEFGCLGLEAHGEAVGLPADLMGNSEVGHLNIGAGRIVYQDILRIQKMLDSPMNDVDAWTKLIAEARSKPNSRVHLLGLVSDGGVHSHIDHLLKLIDHLDIIDNQVCIHAITDGRDTAPQSCRIYLERLQKHLKDHKTASIGTVMGRYYAMDRDKRWERTEIAYNAMTQGIGEQSTAQQLDDVVSQRYGQNENDEFLKPIITNPSALIKDGDICLFFNFRSDRMRQIVEAFSSPSAVLPMASVKPSVSIYTMTKFRHDFDFPVLSPPQVMKNVLAEWLSTLGIRQAHVAETEKFSHVTVFFNGGREKAFEGEERVLIPSPKVATYDLKPEMSSAEVAAALIAIIEREDCPFVMCNFAPPDMVGHTGKLQEAISAVEATDKAIGLVYEACEAHGYTMAVTADHGNAEKMIDEATGAPHTAHTCALVPLIVTDSNKKLVDIGRKPALCDVAPTMLHLMNVDIPFEMSGLSVFE